VVKTRLGPKLLRGFALLAVLTVFGIGALLGAIWFERSNNISIPIPTGSLPVSRAIYDGVDQGALDRLAPIPRAKRELLVWIWYPAATNASAATDEYVPQKMRAAAAPSSRLLGFVTRDLAHVHGHSSRGAEMPALPRAFPVVILRAGASAQVWNYSTLAEDLASHGYVVVGFDAPYRTITVVFPDGRVMSRRPENDPERCEGTPHDQQGACVAKVLTAWVADTAFVLDELQASAQPTLPRHPFSSGYPARGHRDPDLREGR
jgi:hypothetical protein